MQIPVYLKRINANTFHALIPSVPASTGTGNTIGEAISNVRTALAVNIEKRATPEHKLLITFPSNGQAVCSIQSTDNPDGCWTSIEYHYPERQELPIHLAEPKPECSVNERRQQFERRRWQYRRQLSSAEVTQTRFVFPATYHHACCITQSLRILMEDRIAGEQLNELEIGVMEAITNIVRHAYKRASLQPIEVVYQTTAEGISLEFADAGEPLPETMRNAAHTAVLAFDADDIGNLPEGGMGVALIHAVFDSVNYSLSQGINRLHLFKRC